MDMDMISVGIGLLVGLLGIAFLGLLILVAWFFRERQEFQERLAVEVQAAKDGRLSSQGVNARAQYSARRMAALTDTARALNAEGADVKSVLMQMAMKYPDVAAQAMQNPAKLLEEVKRMGLLVDPAVMEQLQAAAPPPPAPTPSPK